MIILKLAIFETMAVVRYDHTPMYNSLWWLDSHVKFLSCLSSYAIQKFAYDEIIILAG